MFETKINADVLSIAAVCLLVVGELLINQTSLIITFPVLINMADIIYILPIGVATAGIIQRKTELRLHQMFLLVGVVVFLAISAQRTCTLKYIASFVVILSCINSDFEKIAGVTSIVLSCVIAAVILVCLLGIIVNKDYQPKGGLIYSWGFGHPNTAGAAFFSIMCFFCFWRWHRENWFVIPITCIGFALISFFVFGSRTSTVLLMVLGSVVVILHASQTTRKLLRNTLFFSVSLIAIFVFFSLSSIFLMVFYDGNNEVMHSLSVFFNNRLELANNAFREYGFTWLGRTIDFHPWYHWEETGLRPNGVDNAYDRLMLTCGTCVCVLLAAIYIIAVVRMSCDPDERKWVLIALSVVFLFIEFLPTSLCFNFSLLFMSYAFCNGKKCTLKDAA